VTHTSRISLHTDCCVLTYRPLTFAGDGAAVGGGEEDEGAPDQTGGEAGAHTHVGMCARL